MTNFGEQDGPLSLAIASIIVGTTGGPSTLYSRSRSSIHQHAMNVSIRKAGERARPLSVDTNQQVVRPKPRSELMSRFKAHSGPSRHHECQAESRRRDRRLAGRDVYSTRQIQSAEFRPRVEPTFLSLSRNLPPIPPFQLDLDPDSVNRLRE
jgi:hypothetical protein